MNVMESRPFHLHRVVELARGGDVIKASVHVYAPTFEQNVWRCAWRMDVFHPEGISMTGDDGFDAFIRSLRFIGKLLRDCETDGWNITWQTPGDHGGFPLVEQL
jgi:hypothetical protein